MLDISSLGPGSRMVSRAAVSWRQSINGHRAHSAGLEYFAFEHDPWDTYSIENALRQPYAILFVENQKKLFALVGNEYQRTPGRRAQLRAEGMIVIVHVNAQVTIRVGDFASQFHRLSRFCLSHQEINVSLLGQFPRFCQVENQGLDLGVGHLVQLTPISELESAQSQRRDCAEQCRHRPSISLLSL